MKDDGRPDEAIGHYEEVIRLEGESAGTRPGLYLCRYAAACAAVRASRGEAPRGTQPGETERAALRRRALEWLRKDLALRAEQFEVGKEVNRATSNDWSIASWRTDPALAGVRDPEALAELPDAEREQWRSLWADVAAVADTDTLERGRTLAARRDWARAAESYGSTLTRNPTIDGHFWLEYAALLLLSGDRPGYARACERMVEAHRKQGGPRAYHVARACTLAPESVAEASLPGRLAEKELREFAGGFWSLTEQGALACRAGRFEEAIPFFEQSLRADPRPGSAAINWLWLALAYQRLGKAEEARRWLSKAQEWLDQFGDGMPARAEGEVGLHLHNWLEAHVLRREAEAQIPPEDASPTRQGAPHAGRTQSGRP